MYTASCKPNKSVERNFNFNEPHQVLVQSKYRIEISLLKRLRVEIQLKVNKRVIFAQIDCMLTILTMV